MKGCSFIITNLVKEIGTSPIDSSEDPKGFRLNESNSNMKEALLHTGGLDFDIDVSREGPFSNGSYKCYVTYPLGESSMGSSWDVVRDGGAAIHLLGHGANNESDISKETGDGIDSTFQHNSESDAVDFVKLNLVPQNKKKHT
eukprot:scaffold224_cov276-Chaetoceros_neogracile.AAC.30